MCVCVCVLNGVSYQSIFFSTSNQTEVDLITSKVLATLTMSVGVGRTMFKTVCLSVCSSAFRNITHYSKMNDPKVFKLGIENDLEIYWKRYAFGVKRSRSRVNKSILHTRTASHRHSLGGVTSCLRYRGVVCASLTFARWCNQSSAWD